MKNYLINVKDTLEKFVVVEAENEADALAKINIGFAEDIMLDDIDDFVDRETTVMGIADNEDRNMYEFYRDED